MDKLNELIAIYKDRAKDYRIEAEVSQYLADQEVEDLKFHADESELIATLLENYNQLLDYDQVVMYYETEQLKAKQITRINIPFCNSDSYIKIFDKYSKDEIDKIELKEPLTRDEFIVFIKHYEKCL
jgi:hypothetical protein